MNEGMRCDRISLMDAGKVLACDAPQKLIEERKKANLEDAFIAYMEDARASGAAAGEAKEKAAIETAAAESHAPPPAASAWSKLVLPVGRMLAYANNEAVQILRDPVRLAFAFIGSALLMLVFGFGITTDVENIRYSVLDSDQSPESREYLEQFKGAPRYFKTTAPIFSDDAALKRLQSDDISLVVEMPPNFG